LCHAAIIARIVPKTSEVDLRQSPAWELIVYRLVDFSKLLVQFRLNQPHTLN